jgi:hypothetical protein
MLPAPYEIVEYVRSPIKASLMATCRLVFFIQPNQVSYLIISPKEEIIFCKEFTNTQIVSQSVFLRFILEKETIISSTFLDTRVYISEAPFTLIPEVFWRDDYKVPLSRLLLKDVFDRSELTHTAIPALSARLLFPRPSMTLNFLDQYIHHYTLAHVSSLLLAITERLQMEYDEFILSLLLEGQVLISAVVDGELRICNRYLCQSPADTGYFIQTAKNTVGMKAEAPHFILGDVEHKEKAGASSLWHYFPKMRFPEFIRPIIGEIDDSLPWWRFAFLNP